MGSISAENVRTGLTINRELKKEMEMLAKKQNRSFNNLVITILKEYMDTQK